MKWTWILTGLSILGAILNIKQKRICFWIWAFTNAAWMVVDFVAGIYSQSALFAVYVGFAIWGIVEWKEGKYE